MNESQKPPPARIERVWCCTEAMQGKPCLHPPLKTSADIFRALESNQ